MHDVAVIGAGPAGLAAATAARSLGADVVIVEQGKSLHARSQNDRVDILSGVGGAGLYSDGKFSFYPSATALWHIKPKRLLASAYEWLSGLLSHTGLAVPDFPLDPINNKPRRENDCFRKEYPSFYLPLGERNEITNRLATSLEDCTQSENLIAQLDDASSNEARFRGPNGVVRARRAVLAPGRFGPLMMARSLPSEKLVFRRVELGIRIEQPADEFLLFGDKCLDPKFLSDISAGRSWRTFCCCRNGLIVVTSAAGMTMVSGRADCPPTGRSSVGLLVRYTEPQAGWTAWREAQRAQPAAEPAVVPLSQIMDREGRVRDTSRVAHMLGAETAWHLAGAINDLANLTGRVLTDAVLYAPMVEGVGLYPKIDSNLQIPGRPMFVAGDATGIFRGLTAALLSGYVAGSNAVLSGHRAGDLGGSGDD